LEASATSYLGCSGGGTAADSCSWGNSEAEPPWTLQMHFTERLPDALSDQEAPGHAAVEAVQAGREATRQGTQAAPPAHRRLPREGKAPGKWGGVEISPIDHAQGIGSVLRFRPSLLGRSGSWSV
jgi:hypothetical protein